MISQLSSEFRFLPLTNCFHLNLLVSFSIEKITSSIDNVSEIASDPIAIFKSPLRLFTLAFHGETLVLGCAGCLLGYKIAASGVIQSKLWTIELPIPADSSELNEVNDLWVDKESDLIYAACGDGILYCCSLDDGRFVRKFEGHTDYLHSVHGS